MFSRIIVQRCETFLIILYIVVKELGVRELERKKSSWLEHQVPNLSSPLLLRRAGPPLKHLEQAPKCASEVTAMDALECRELSRT
jgi:hypothetical protein